MDTQFLAQMLVDTLVSKGIEPELAEKVIATARQLDHQTTPSFNSPNIGIVSFQLGIGPNKIQTIKEIRAMTGWGLKESKQAVEDPTTIYRVPAHAFEQQQNRFVAINTPVYVV